MTQFGIYFYIFVYIYSYVSPGTHILLFVTNPLPVFDSKSTIKIDDKFIQGLTEINTETAFTVRCFKVLERSTPNKLHN